MSAEPAHAWEPGFEPAAVAGAGDLVFAFHGGRLLVAGAARVPCAGDLLDRLAGVSPVGVGRLAGRLCFAAALAEAPALAGHELVGLRDLFARLPAPVAAAAGRAAQIVEWELAHAFCGRCGAPTAVSESELARRCTRCAAAFYPRISPAVIMLVEREGRMLLARRAMPATAFHSCLAGFVEPGETLEEAVAREVLEEVGLEVEAVRYLGSQPWPFPSQLMIAFTARSSGGELRLDDAELAEAAWYGADDELPPIPPPYTIARTLIDDFLRRSRAVRPASSDDLAR